MFRSRLRLFVFVASTGLAACNADTPVTPGPTPEPPPPPPPPPALQFGTFDLSQAEGQALPAYIAHRLVNGELEQVYVDSAQLVVQASGRFEQRIYMRTLRAGAMLRRDTWVDGGQWQRDGADYTFASTSGSRTLRVRTAMSPVLSVTERMVGWPGAGLVVGVYTRRTSPPPVNPGPPPVQEMRFRATDVSGQSLPQIVVREVDVPHEGAETYSQLDSAWVVLRTDGTYERRAFYSTWMSPNYRYSLGYGRVGRVNDYDHGRYARSSDGTLQLFSAYWQHRTATGIDLGDRVRLTQDMLAGDPVRPNVGYTRQVTP